VYGLLEDKADARSRIIEAAAEIIGREKNLNLTIRDIAARAGVNIASINYYFRSKENLLEEVERVLLEKVKSIYTGLFDQSIAARERLINWADKLSSYLIDYPGLVYMIGTRILERESTGLNEYLKLMETGLTPVVGELTGIKDSRALSFKVVHLISGVVYPILIHSSREKTAGIDIDDTFTRQKYLSSLVSMIERT
jgi:TetR/AcrR family transcriptional regulator, regulator of cefoperazone and chloramphenicol sensitivity